MVTKNSFNDFLNVASNQNEVAIAIAKNPSEIESFSRSMNKAGFKKSKDVEGLLSNSKTYFIIDKKIDKDVYDFVVQYPTGQVEIFDKKNMKSQTLVPNYHKSTVVLIALKSNLKKLQTEGFDILSKTGPAYQS